MYQGIIPPLITPLDETGNVDENSVRRLIVYVEAYSTALMPTLSSGEGWALNETQWRDMVVFTKRYAHTKPVLVGILLPTTEETVKRALVAKELNTDAIVITTPFEKNITQDQIFNHFEKIKIETAGMPVFIYNEEVISGNAIILETIKRIINLGNIVGIKEASGSIEFTKQLREADLGVPIFQGWENLCYESKGVDGYILPLSNLESKLCLEMFENPTQERQTLINNFCEKYNLLGKTWYKELKKELKTRGVISNDKTA